MNIVMDAHSVIRRSVMFVRVLIEPRNVRTPEHSAASTVAPKKGELQMTVRVIGNVGSIEMGGEHDQHAGRLSEEPLA
jgi:hypothetical protein